MKLNQVDFCFVVDTTGSMGPFLNAAKQQLVNLVTSLAAETEFEVRYGLVEYRDHPPQERTFITRVYPLTADTAKFQKTINQLAPAGGGDAPEAVYRGLHDAVIEMDWARHGCRFMMLVGDAPPHGLGMRGDHWPDACPSHLDHRQVTALIEESRVTLHALHIGHDRRYTLPAFTRLAAATGGSCRSVAQGQQVLDQIVELLKEEFAGLETDLEVLRLVGKSDSLDPDRLAGPKLSRLQVARSLARLGKRDLLDRYLEP